MPGRKADSKLRSLHSDPRTRTDRWTTKKRALEAGELGSPAGSHATGGWPLQARARYQKKRKQGFSSVLWLRRLYSTVTLNQSIVQSNRNSVALIEGRTAPAHPPFPPPFPFPSPSPPFSFPLLSHRGASQNSQGSAEPSGKTTGS